MDLGDLLILLIFLAPLLRRIFGGKPQQKPRPLPPPEQRTRRQAEAEPVDDPLAEALRQIRAALGEEPKHSEAEPKIETAPSWTRLQSAEPDSEFHEVGEFEHDAHGFGRENPLSEEVFERRPAFVTTGGTDPIGTHAPDTVDLSTPLEVEKRTLKRGPSLASILRDPQRAREAFILHEVFDRPGGRRRR